MYKNNFVVVIKYDGRILREIDGEVSLPFGSQYSILLKNKDSKKALVDIEVDGENVLTGKSLIMNGRTSQEIKGFMRNMSVTNRFKFIHKTKEISNYRGDRLEDGLITVCYKFEREKPKPIMIRKNTGPCDWVDPIPYPLSWPYSDIKYTSSPVYRSSSYKLDVPLGGFEGTVTMTAEDGITVKGSQIDQQYKYGDIGDLESRSYTITIQLKGITKYKKPVVRSITTKTKLRCPTCGRRSKSSSTFCYNCGTYLR